MAQKQKSMIVRQIPEDLLRSFKSECASQGKSMNKAMIELMEIFSHWRLVLIPQDIIEVLKTTHTVLGEKLIANEIADEDDTVKNLQKRMFGIIRRLGDLD